MPLRWRIDHAARRVTATLLETTSESEMYDFLGEVIAQGAMAYGKLLVAPAGIPWTTPGSVGPFAATARLYGRMGLGPIGPLAILVDSTAAQKRLEAGALLSGAKQPVRVFRRQRDAEAWLAASTSQHATHRRDRSPAGAGGASESGPGRE